MHKIFSSDFEIDLSTYKISIVEENSWFSDKFFAKYSFPFEFELSDDLNNKMGDLLSVDSYSSQKHFEVKYQFYDKIENAILIVEEIQNRTVKFSLKYGADEIPGGDLYLSDLKLQKHTVDNIYLHARQTLEKTWPETNYNFPMIYTEKYSSDEEMFNQFSGILNNNDPVLGFLQNWVNDNDEMLNYNIVHPLVYVMYVLQKGFANNGLTLAGDIMNDALLKKLMLFCPKDYFRQAENNEDLSIYIYNEDAPPLPTNHPFVQNVTKQLIIPQPGKYNIIGEYVLKKAWPIGNEEYHFLYVKKNGQILTMAKMASFQGEKRGSIYLDLIVPVTEPNTVIEVEMQMFFNPEDYDTPLSLEVLPIYFLNEDGEKVTGLINDNEIDLNRAVPDMTFENFVTNVLSLFNYSIDSVENNHIYINKVANSMRENEKVNMSDYENINMVRKPKYEIDFLFKYDQEGEDKLPGVYINHSEKKLVEDDFKKEVENTIQFKAFPLQEELIYYGMPTANGNVEGTDKLYLVLFGGIDLESQYSVTENPAPLSILNIVDDYHYEWIDNRIKSAEFKFTFVAEIENIVNLDVKKRGYIYNQIHLFKTINKTEISPGLFEVEIESENLSL